MGIATRRGATHGRQKHLSASCKVAIVSIEAISSILSLLAIAMKPIHHFSLFAIAAVVLMSSGCATVVSKKQYAVNIDNQPGPTYYQVYNRKNELVSQGITPQQVTLDAKSAPFVRAKYSVVMAGTGSATQTQTVKAGFDPWTIGNIAIGGGLGAIVDGASGAMFTLPPSVTGNVASQYAVTDATMGAKIASAAIASPIDSTLQNQLPPSWQGGDGGDLIAQMNRTGQVLPVSTPTKTTRVMPASAVLNKTEN